MVRVSLSLVILGCRETPEESEQDPVPLDNISMTSEITCPDPDAREEAPFDVVEEGDWVNRFDSNGAWGVAIAELNGDEWLDMLVTSGSKPMLFLGSPTGLLNATDQLPEEVNADYRASTPADIDGDGDLDLFLGGREIDDYLLVNDGSANFTARFLQDGTRTMGASFGDVDLDGDLDLAVANGANNTEPVLFLNDGMGNFTDHDELVPEDFQKGSTFVMAALDIDRDGAIDLYRVNDAGPWGPGNQVAWNRGGSFVADDGSSGLNIKICSMGLGIGDINGDLEPDFAITDCQDLHLLESTGPVWVNYADARNLFIDPETAHNTPWGVDMVDLDNDGDLDIYVGYGFLINGNWEQERVQLDGLYLQQPDGSFVESAAQWGILPGQSRGFATADLNNDGWLDIVKQDWLGKPMYYRSRCGSERWLRVSLDQGPGHNRSAVGAQVIVESKQLTLTRWILAGGHSVSSAGPPEAHFGLRSSKTVDIRVIWPDGAEDSWVGVPTNRRITLFRP